jgi:hypothetical protein
MVTSTTNVARLVQSGGLVGLGGSGVELAVGGVVVRVDVSVADSVSVAVTDGVADAGGAKVSVEAGVAVSTGACPPQAESMIAIREITMKSFLDIINLHCSPTGI